MMKHAILLLWHKDIEQLVDLINFFDEDFTFFIHVDKKSKGFVDEIRELKNNMHVYCKYKVNWAGFNIVRAEMFLLKRIIEDGNHYDYVHFLSGQDYPIKSLIHFKRFFVENRGKEFIEYMKLPAQKWEHGTFFRLIYYRFYDWFDVRTSKGKKYEDWLFMLQLKLDIKRPVPNQFSQLYGGSNWMSLTYECAKFIVVGQRKVRSFYNRMKFTFAADETYFHTVILNSPFREHVENRNMRHIVWTGYSSPKIFTSRDFYRLYNSPALLARKFDYRYSRNLVKMINKFLLNEYSANVPSEKDVVLFVTHVLNENILERYYKLKRQAGNKDVIMLLNDETGKIEGLLPDDVDVIVFTAEMLNDLGYEPLEETLIPGSNHFALLWFYKMFPNYRNYWNIEYDVDFTGHWNALFDGFEKCKADFISSHIQKYDKDRHCKWWNSWHGETLDVPLVHRLHSFNPIYRMSAAALNFIDKFLKKGNYGHHEVLLPTALFHSGFDVVDFGGKGEYVIPGNEERYYLSSDIMLDDGYCGSMRMKPHFIKAQIGNMANKLLHPIKNE